MGRREFITLLGAVRVPVPRAGGFQARSLTVARPLAALPRPA